jgi:RNA ligase (TIGR02306 family)
MEKSTHKAEVFKIDAIYSHPNADRLEIIRYCGYSIVVAKGLHEVGKKLVYIPPDTIVDTTRPEFAYLAKPGETKYHVKAKKLRQVPSFGILVAAPEGAAEGDNLFEQLGCEHYEPAEPAIMGGDECVPPVCFAPKYDVDTLKRYVDKFVPGEEVIVTEKIHGASARYTVQDGVMYCGSRTGWKKEDERSAWWKALRGTPGLEEFCKKNVNYIVYGEIYGAVQDLKYGCKPGEIRFAMFDIWNKDEARWLNYDEIYDVLGVMLIPSVPFVARCPFNIDHILSLAEGKTLVLGATHVKEGVCVRPVKERTDLEIGRVHLKVVGLGYLERK